MPASTSRSPACSRRAWWCTRPIRKRGRRMGDAGRGDDRGAGDARTRHAAARPASRSRSARIEKMSKSKKNTVDPDDIIGDLRRRHRALVRAVGFAARARRRTGPSDGVQGALALRAAAVAADRRGRRARENGARPTRPAAFGERARWRSARPRTARSPRSRTLSRSCTSTSASRTSTNSPTRWAHAIGSRRDRADARISPGRCARPPTSWCGCSTR